MSEKLILKEECYKIIGLAMKVHSYLGPGFKEVVYKDALELEFIKNGIPYMREKIFSVPYFENILKSRFSCDFFVFQNVIVEVKAKRDFHSDHFEQTLNYLKAAKVNVGLVFNFGKKSLEFRRVICTE